jgi:hypothetical protein
LFAAAPAALAPDQLHRGGEAGRVGQVVLAATVIGCEDSAVAAGDDLGTSGLNGQAQQPPRMLGVGVGIEALNGEQVQVLQPEQLIGDGVRPGGVGEGAWAAGGVQGATVRWSVAGQRT